MMSRIALPASTLLLAASLAILVWMACLQASPDNVHAALLVAVAYAAFCAVTLLRHRRRIAGRAFIAAPADSAGSLLIAHASQTGQAEELARRTAEALRDEGMPVRVDPLGRVEAAGLEIAKRVLFVVSTTGEGDAPDSAARFTRQVLGREADLRELRYGLLSLGDRSYNHFCGFGRSLEAWLRQQGATPLFDTVEVDNGDAGALRHWQYHMGLLSGSSRMKDWQPAHYGRWRLAERRLLNPGSLGGEVFHVALEPLDGQPSWAAGDIAEIGPRDPLDPEAPQPHREYSIASLPTDGRVELLVRRMDHPDGRPGLGSGWLTRHAPLGSAIDMRIRTNRSFHAPPEDVPLILIGNGTGLAGLRSHLKARLAAGRRRNWLIFGERSRAHDFFYEHEIESWRSRGWLDRLDLAFSRDQPERLYVQHRLAEAADQLRRWVDEGAAIYVCGSLIGMASGVAAVLEETLGQDVLDTLAADGRYRRDVY
ncbi:sulfite reductase subunit alpha [Iodidimonas sp. SYSU 1G8]|uniref:sulfite reductase subunit alpha n=1 Tax=Iodidimonas sp. SYSU 1G8 TaxID=3133967 RepID=UPI0031FEEA41